VLETTLLTEREKIIAVASIMDKFGDTAVDLSRSMGARDPAGDTIDDLTRLAKKYVDVRDKKNKTWKEEWKAARSFVNFMASLAWLVINMDRDLTDDEQKHVINVITALEIETRPEKAIKENEVK